MRRPVPLSTLTSGRCFTLAAPPAPAELADHGDGGPQQVGSVFSRSVLRADAVFKVIGVGPGEAEGIEVVDATGAASSLPGETAVVEVPREGYERLAQRAREEEAS